MSKQFVHLHLHTEYSLSDGLLSFPALFAKAAQLNMPAMAITDRNNLYAAVKFYRAALDAGIKPILGADLMIADAKHPTGYLLTVLCQTQTGYQNLLKLISKSYIEGQASGKPLVHPSWLKQYAEGLIALSGGMAGELGQTLLAERQDQARIALETWLSIFQDRFYMNVSRIGQAQEENYIAAARELAASYGVPIVATNAVCFLEPEDFEAHEARVCIQEGVTLADPRRTRRYSNQQYFRHTNEMQHLFNDMPEVLTNTLEIAKRCSVNLSLGHNQLPHFPTPASESAEEYLATTARQGLEERLRAIFDVTTEDFLIQRRIYDERLMQELTVINQMGFAGYFLIVADFTKWAKENGIPVGPGRGSGPGSLAAYALYITDLDPIAFDLLFERFLNPERVSLPDFDIDFCIAGRDRVIDYVIQRYGAERVAQVMTYGTMAAKAVVRDAGRVLGQSYGMVDKIAKLIPFELGITLEKAMEQEPLLKERYEQEEEVRTLIDLAKKLEGITRNVGKHAGGIVIAPGELVDFAPLYCEPNETMHPVTQFDKDDIEAVGLIKFDFLGLKTLTVIDQALKNIHRAHPDIHININHIPLDDAKTFDMLKACRSTAVFQLESHGMRDLIKRLQPDRFDDLIALVALFRPGPLQSGMVDDFIERRHGRAKVYYPHPQLEPILRPTYGVILYQEQVMQIAQVLAGYTLGAADILRRAMGKKKPEEMAKQREIFCEGATQRGVPYEKATSIFDLMEKFAGYGFNKSHSAAYALIAYQTAWLKTHYPAAFMAAMLSADIDHTDKIITLLDECKILSLVMTPPTINQSHDLFYPMTHDRIIYELGAIKGVGLTAAQHIMDIRKKSGIFTSLFDFCKRIELRKIGKRAMEAMIKAGCFDELLNNRAQLMASLAKALQEADQLQQNTLSGQRDLLAIYTTPVESSYCDVPAWSQQEQLQGEKETLGFYLSGHPFDRYREELNHCTTCSIAGLQENIAKVACIAGAINRIRIRHTKRGDKIGVFTLEDGNAQVEIVCFSDCFTEYRQLIIQDQLIIVQGEVGIDDFNQQRRIIARELFTIETARERFAKYVRLHVQDITQLFTHAMLA